MECLHAPSQELCSRRTWFNRESLDERKWSHKFVSIRQQNFRTLILRSSVIPCDWLPSNGNQAYLQPWIVTKFIVESIPNNLFQPQYQNVYSPHCLTYNYYATCWENLSKDQGISFLVIFPLFSWLKCLIKQRHCKEKLDVGHHWGLKS